MKVVAYTRFSSDRVGEEVPQDAILIRSSIIEEYANSKGWTIEKKYSDRKHSKDTCEAFEELKNDGIYRKFDLIVIDSIFHFGRGYTYAEELLLRVFYPAGIHFAVAEDDFVSLEHSADEVSQYFYGKRWKNYSDKAHDAEKVKLSPGELYRQSIRYGYIFSADRTHYEIDDEAAPIIQEIFKRYADGETFNGIATDLNKRGVIAPPDRKAQTMGKTINSFKPARWNPAAIKRTLSNEIYTGHGFRSYFKQMIPLEVPPIISQELFDKVKARMEANGPRNMDWRTEQANVFTGLVFDQASGKELMTANWSNGDGRRYYIFRNNHRYVTKEYVAKGWMLSYDDMIKKVKEELETEISLAKSIEARFLSEEGVRALEAALADMKNESKGVFNEMCEKSTKLFEAERACNIRTQEEISEKLEQLNETYESIWQRTQNIKKAYSSRNPWLLKYAKAKVLEDINRKFVRKYVGGIVVTNFKYISLTPFEENWKLMLPKEWLIAEGRQI